MDPISIAIALAQFAPSLMKYFGVGNKGISAAEKAIDIAKAVAGVDSGPEALEVFKIDPARAFEYKQAVLAAESDLDKAFLADRDSARKRDMAYVAAGQHNVRGDVLAYIAIGALVLLIVMLFLKGSEMPDSVRDLLLVLSGSLVAIVKDVYSFEFGTTRASKVKDLTISSFTKD